MAQESLTSASKGIRIDEAADGGIVISALQVVEPGFSVVALATDRQNSCFVPDEFVGRLLA